MTCYGRDVADVFRRKARTMEELLGDSGFPYHVGQMIGAAEMAAWWMSLQEDADTQKMGEKLAETVNWFFKDNPSARLQKRSPERATESLP